MKPRPPTPANATALPRLHTFVLGGVCALALLSAAPGRAQSPSPATAPQQAPAAPATPAALPAAPAALHAGILKSVRGDVKLVRADGQSQPARSGDLVNVVDRLQTGADSGVSLSLRDGTVLVLGPQSQLDLKQYQFNATTHDGNLLLSLLQGSMRMVSGLIAKKQPEAVRVDTQTATIGIRGTDFIVDAQAQP